jgi:ABC-type transport system involved in multi-copper enzyme maturation permease subunit
MMNAVASSLARLGWIARNTMREAVRQRIFVFVVVLAVLMVAGALLLREFNFGTSELKFLADFGFGALTLFGSLLAVVVTAQLFFGEIENRTVLTILAKPVRRSEFIAGKFLGVWAVLLVFCVVVALTLLLVLYTREAALLRTLPDRPPGGELVDYGGIIAYCVLQWLKFGVVAGFTMLIASYAHTNLFTIAAAFLVLVICHLQHLAQDAWKHGASAGTRAGAWLLAHVFPNFQLFNVGDRVAGGHGISLELVGRVAAYALVYVAVTLGLATYLFRRREV